MAAAVARSAAIRRERGVTLIELMIVLVIMSILASIALPAYLETVRKARRSDAMASIMDIASRQEKFYVQNSTYTTVVDTDAGLNLGRTTSTEGFYTLTVEACADKTIATCYLVKATPAGKQVEDTQCAVLSYTSLNQKTASGALGASCWK